MLRKEISETLKWQITSEVQSRHFETIFGGGEKVISSFFNKYIVGAELNIIEDKDKSKFRKLIENKDYLELLKLIEGYLIITKSKLTITEEAEINTLRSFKKLLLEYFQEKALYSYEPSQHQFMNSGFRGDYGCQFSVYNVHKFTRALIESSKSKVFADELGIDFQTLKRKGLLVYVSPNFLEQYDADLNIGKKMLDGILYELTKAGINIKYVENCLPELAQHVVAESNAAGAIGLTGELNNSTKIGLNFTTAMGLVTNTKVVQGINERLAEYMAQGMDFIPANNIYSLKRIDANQKYAHALVKKGYLHSVPELRELVKVNKKEFGIVLQDADNQIIKLFNTVFTKGLTSTLDIVRVGSSDQFKQELKKDNSKLKIGVKFDKVKHKLVLADSEVEIDVQEFSSLKNNFTDDNFGLAGLLGAVEEMLKQKTKLANLDEIMKLKREQLANLDEAIKFYPDTKVTERIEAAMKSFLKTELTFDQNKKKLEKMIADKADSDLITKTAKEYQEVLTRFNEELLALTGALSYEEDKTFKKILDVYQVLTHTPRGVQEQEFPRKFIYQDEDKVWHLRPEALEIVFTPEMLEPWSTKNPNGLNLEKVIKNKTVQYSISTAGVRDKQNTLFPWDGSYNINFSEEIITAYSQVLTLVLNATRKDSELQKLISLMKDKIKDYRSISNKGASVKDVEILAELINQNYPSAVDIFYQITDKLKKLCGSEVRFNSELMQEIFVRVSAALGVEVHTPLLDGDNKTSIWMASFLIFAQDFDGGNYVTSSHARREFACSKDLSEEGAQYLPEISVSFAAVNEWILKQIKEKGKFTIKLSAQDDPKIHRDVDGTEEYIELLKTSVWSPENIALINKAADRGYSLIQDCVSGCMGPLMKKIYKKIGLEKIVKQINIEYDSYQSGIGKGLIVKNKHIVDEKFNAVAQLPEIIYDDQGVDASLKVVVERMAYKYHLKDEPIGRMINNTDPDGDRFVAGQIMANDKKLLAELDFYGINYIALSPEKIFAYYSPNKMFLMTTDFYLMSLIRSKKLVKGDTVLIFKTAQTSYAFNEYAKRVTEKTGVNVVAIEPTVGFKEIASAERDVEELMLLNKERIARGEEPQDIIVIDALNKEYNLGHGKIVMLSGDEESGGQELAPPDGVTSKLGRFALGNREKSAGVASFLSIAFGADLFLKNMTILDYWKQLIKEYDLTFIQDERHDEQLYDPGILDPEELKRQKAFGNDVKKPRNNRFWWNLARSYVQKELDIDQVQEILVDNFAVYKYEEGGQEKVINIDPAKLRSLKFILPVLTAGKKDEDRAKDGVYLFFEDFYIAIRPSGTDPKIKGYYSGRFNAREGLQIAKAMASYSPEAVPGWQTVNYYEKDVYK